MAKPARARLASAVRRADHDPTAENIRHAMSRRERKELRDALESRARIMEESRDELRGRAERAERDRLRRDTGDQTALTPQRGGAAATSTCMRFPDDYAVHYNRHLLHRARDLRPPRVGTASARIRDAGVADRLWFSLPGALAS